jgi:mannose-6-phosphate isomerase-like protein (cupin superfamily)
MSVATGTKAETFSLKTPYLTQGITTDTLASADGLRVAMKVYAEGGENRMHCHLNEVHSFVVLEGEATFYLNSEDNTQVVKLYQGVMIPKGALYRFQSSGEGNLVMLRISSVGPNHQPEAFYPDGVKKSQGLEAGQHVIEPIAATGPGFAPNA